MSSQNFDLFIAPDFHLPFAHTHTHTHRVNRKRDATPHTIEIEVSCCVMRFFFATTKIFQAAKKNLRILIIHDALKFCNMSCLFEKTQIWF